MTDEEIIETAIQGHASTRDAIRWSMKQVRMQANTHKSDPVVRQLVEALKHCSGWVEAYGRSESRNEVRAALAAAKEAGF